MSGKIVLENQRFRCCWVMLSEEGGKTGELCFDPIGPSCSQDEKTWTDDDQDRVLVAAGEPVQLLFRKVTRRIRISCRKQACSWFLSGI